MRKTKRRRSIKSVTIIAASVFMLNVCGISYAHWNNDMEIQVSVSTSDIYPYFIRDGIKVVGNEKEEVNVKADKGKRRKIDTISIIDDESIGNITATSDGNVLDISGWCYPNFNKNIFIEIGNDGSLPIIYSGLESHDKKEIIKQINYQGINIIENNKKMKNNQQNIINKKEEDVIEIHINAENENKTDYGNHPFNYKLVFEQGLR